MKVGDMVKFREVLNHSTQELTDFKFGLVVEYQERKSTAVVLCGGNMLRLPVNIMMKAEKNNHSKALESA